jgi:hypothetical protein
MAVMHQGDIGYYRYGGTPKPDKAALEAEKIRKLLKSNRQRLAFNASSSRPLSVRLNQHVAQALRDGMKVTRLAQAAGLSRWTIRTIGLTYDDLLPSGQPAEQQLADHCRAEVRACRTGGIKGCPGKAAAQPPGRCPPAWRAG